MSRFLDILRSRQILLMDGAMGTELQRLGLGHKDNPAHWNLTHPERVHCVHRRYVEAGARVLVTNTFQASSPALARHGLADQFMEVHEAALAIARAECPADGFVLGDIGPVDGRDPGEELSRCAQALRGSDAILLETLSDFEGIQAFADSCINSRGELGPQLLISFSFVRNSEGDLRSLAGLLPEEVAERANTADIAALGTNCGREITMADMAEIIRRYRNATDLPLFARPNAGTPIAENGAWIYPHSAEDMAAGLGAVLDSGAVMVGGCCGTTPAHIQAFQKLLSKRRAI